MAAESSKELLLDQPSPPSFPETLLVGGKRPALKAAAAAAVAVANGDAEAKPLTAAAPRSQVLDKVKDFLGVIAQANEKLELDVRERSRADYDVEALTGNEKEVIEMDLLLGVADLHTAEAVAAAEAAMSCVRPSAASISSSSSFDSDDDDESDQSEKLHVGKDETVRSDKRNKRPKIVVIDSSSH